MKKIHCILAVVLCGILSFTACGKEPEFLEESSGSFAEMQGEELSETKLSDSLSNNDTDQMVFVHITGAVCEPGVYELPMGSRLFEAVELAGGFLPEAAEDYCNLAKVIEDGQQYHILTKEEALAAESLQEAGVGESHYTSDGRLDINLASKEELMELPGIGETRADAILAYRTQHGDLENTEELMNISGIKQALYEEIAPFITVR